METLTTITSGINVPTITGYQNILQGVRFPSVSWSVAAPTAAPTATPVVVASKKDEEGTPWWVWLIIVLIILVCAAFLAALKYNKQNQR